MNNDFIHIITLLYFGKPTFFNQRIYYKKDFQGVVDNLFLTNQITTDVVSLGNICGICKYKVTDEKIIVKIQFLATEQGKIIKELMDIGFDLWFSPMFTGVVCENNVVKDYTLSAVHVGDVIENRIYRREILTEKVIKFD